MPCDPWQLLVKLDFEKEITGMYMSGHPLDNFKFEMAYYQIHPIEDFNEIKNTIQTQPNTRSMRLAGMIIDPQHRLTKAGKQFASFHLEDYTGKTEFLLWNEDYVKYSNYLENGRIVMIEGGFRQRFSTSPYEFKVSKFHLLDTVKSTLTKQVILDMDSEWIDEKFIEFLETNIQSNPGKTSLKINVLDMLNQRKISLSTLEKGFTLNDDFIHFLGENLHIKTQVALQNG
jgi:DNA polymerase-3 subunit alpha